MSRRCLIARILAVGLWLGVVLLKGFGATLVVSNTNDSGAGSLRQAIIDANATNLFGRIVFQIPGSGVHTIAPLTALPTITNSVALDATTQPGYSNQPLIELDGSNVTGDAGLKLLAANSVVRGLAINRFGTDGIQVQKGGANVIQANFIGTDPFGTLSRPNRREGVWLNESFGNIVGGTNTGDRNVISGNGDAGLYVLEGGSNLVQGNFMGMTITGTGALANGNSGIILYNSPGNQVGGGAGAGNIISGNHGSGIYLSGPAATQNILQGNYVGTSSNGRLAVENSGDGVTLVNAGSNLIGGTNSGEGNVISGNAKAGIFLNGTGAEKNLVQGNIIGGDVTGSESLGNAYAGITLSAASCNLIGGSVLAARNVISGNTQDGIFLATNSSANVVAGNFIGVDVAGANPLPNQFNGVSLSGAGSNTIGGAVPGSGNVISGNVGYGVHLLPGATVNHVQGNYIGSDNTGCKTVGNQLSGVRVESGENTIGGRLSGERNLISGNHDDGVWLVGAGASNNVIQGNFIGTDLSGSTRLGNNRSGIGISDAAANIIGGTDAAAGNLVSGNVAAGIYLIGPGVNGNRIAGNTIGADVTGTKPLGNELEGIYVESAAANLIGGTQPGEGNLISANRTRGIWLTNASWNVIQDNLIGTARDGMSPLGNTFHGVECEAGSTNNIIGGFGQAENEIAYSGTVYAGVRIRNGSFNNAILGNAIFANGALGIDLGSAGTTTNDTCDLDQGGNMLQNFPVLSQAVTGQGTGVRGSLNSTPNSTFLLQFFAVSDSAASGQASRPIHLGDLTVTTDEDCTASFVGSFPLALPSGFLVTATATDAANNTSEFSVPLAVESAPRLSITGLAESRASIRWNASPAGFLLKETSSLTSPILWTAVTNTLTLIDGQWVVPIPTLPGSRFYVLSFQ
jgi:titin